MGKIRQYSSADYPWFTFTAHFGGYARDDPLAWHGVYAYDNDTLPPGIMTGLWDIYLPTLAQALLCARYLAALPNLARDICPHCWGTDWWWSYTPTMRRVNIYRGQNRERTPPTIFWDMNNPEAPPGYSYW